MKKNFMLGIVGFCLLFMLATYAQSAVVYVKSDAAGANNGTSWANAFTNFQTAINASAPGDQLWVCKGTYSGSFTSKDGISIYGGFLGNETLLIERNWVLNETILSSGGPILTLSSNNTIDGLIIKNGNYDYGGGINLPSGKSNVSTYNCQFINNRSETQYNGRGGQYSPNRLSQ